jgi:hypothetical protein
MSPHSEPTPDPDDEEIARVRDARHRISERFGHDPYRLVAHYMEIQRQHASARAVEPAHADDGA